MKVFNQFLCLFALIISMSPPISAKNGNGNHHLSSRSKHEYKSLHSKSTKQDNHCKRCAPQKCCLDVTEEPARKLNVLVTNDDGFNIASKTLYSALVAKGYNVYAFVPGENASGKGAGILAISYTILPVDPLNLPNFYAVSSSDQAFNPFPTEAECIMAGMSFMGTRSLPIDVIVAGINLDPSLGPAVPISGTNSGAFFAISGFCQEPYQFTPAITINLADEARTSSVERFDLCGTFAANLVNWLDTHRDSDDRLLPKTVMLKVSVPSTYFPTYVATCGATNIEPPIKGVLMTKVGEYFNLYPQQNQRNMCSVSPDFTIMVDVSSGQQLGPLFGAANFVNQFYFADGFSAEVVLADPLDASSPPINDVAGKIVLVSPGACLSDIGYVDSLSNNIGASGGIGMIFDPGFDFDPGYDTEVNYGAIAGQQYPIPSVAMSTSQAAELRAAILSGATVKVTFNYYIEPSSGNIIYNNSFASNMMFVDPNQLDVNPAADTNAVTNGYIAISPMSCEPTFGVTPYLDRLSCVLAPVLTVGPTISTVCVTNKTSPLLG